VDFGTQNLLQAKPNEAELNADGIAFTDKVSIPFEYSPYKETHELLNFEQESCKDGITTVVTNSNATEISEYNVSDGTPTTTTVSLARLHWFDLNLDVEKIYGNNDDSEMTDSDLIDSEVSKRGVPFQLVKLFKQATTSKFNVGRLIEWIDPNDTNGLKIFYGDYIDNPSIYYAQVVTMQEIYNSYYKDFYEKMFRRYHQITENYFLDVEDIKNFSQSNLIYTDKHGHYFFVNKINNWIAGKMCKVDLIMM
jgi:hypothetical protein